MFYLYFLYFSPNHFIYDFSLSISADYFLLAVLCVVSLICVGVAVSASLHCRAASAAPYPAYTAEARGGNL